MYAPIIIFVYNRPERLCKLVESLSKNPEAIKSEVYFFSDGAKNEAAKSKVEEVRRYIDKISKLKLFKQVHVFKSKKNKGLAASIIDGVSMVMERHGNAIIIEDDNVLASDFLDYMNRGLEYYRNDPQIWAISGFSRKMNFPEGYNHDIYIMQRISSYTWASWSDRWNKTEWDIGKFYPKFLWNKKKRKEFDECGADRSLMLDAQVCNKVNSWAIRFEYSMILNGMYSVQPCISRSLCNGNDGSGTHSKSPSTEFDAQLSDGIKKVEFESLQQDERIREEFIRPYRCSFKRKLIGNWDYKLKYYITYGWRKREKKQY